MRARVYRTERSNCSVCAVNETGRTGEYMEVSDYYYGMLHVLEVLCCRDHY